MKKVLSTIMIAIILVSTFYISSYAALGAKVVATADKTEVKAGETVTLTLTIKDIVDAGTGISAFDGTLEYDTNFFESVAAKSPIQMNTQTGKMLWMGLATEETELGQITLKVKSDATGTGNVKIKGIEFSTGEENGTSADISLDVKIGTGNPSTNTPANNTPVNNTPVNNTPTNNTPANNTPANNTPVNNAVKNNTVTSGKKDDTTSSNVLPKTGVKVTMLVAILVLAVISGLAYRHYKKYEEI